MLKLYENIKKRRLDLHMTQDQLATLMGYSDKGMISKIEKGLVDISCNKVLEFARVLKAHPVELMGWAEMETYVDDPLDEKIAEKINRLPDSQIPKLEEYIDLLDLQATQAKNASDRKSD